MPRAVVYRSLERVMDGHIIHSGTISSCQSAVNVGIIKHCWSRTRTTVSSPQRDPATFRQCAFCKQTEDVTAKPRVITIPGDQPKKRIDGYCEGKTLSKKRKVLMFVMNVNSAWRLINSRLCPTAVLEYHSVLCWDRFVRCLTPSTPAVQNCYCSNGSAPYWSNRPFLIFDIRALWRSVLSARAPECQKLKIVG